jgi:putative transposase
LDFSKQAFYKWKKNLLTTRDWDDVHLVNAALDIHRKDPAFGYRFISDKPADSGVKASPHRVWRLCSQQHIWSVFAKKAGVRPAHRFMMFWLNVTSLPAQ